MEETQPSAPLPPSLDGSLAQHEWEGIRDKFCMSSKSLTENVWRSFLLQTSSQQVGELFKTLGLSQDQTSNFDIILQEIENICLPRFLVIYNRFKLSNYSKMADETWEEYAKQLRQQTHSCLYDSDSDTVIASHIANQITNVSQRQRLLHTPHPDFQTILGICRAEDYGGIENISQDHKETSLFLKDSRIVKTNNLFTSKTNLPPSFTVDQSKPTEQFVESTAKCETAACDVHIAQPPSVGSRQDRRRKLSEIAEVPERCAGEEGKMSGSRKKHDQSDEQHASYFERPKRKISIPLRLKSDANTMKLLKFTERRDGNKSNSNAEIVKTSNYIRDKIEGRQLQGNRKKSQNMNTVVVTRNRKKKCAESGGKVGNRTKSKTDKSHVHKNWESHRKNVDKDGIVEDSVNRRNKLARSETFKGKRHETGTVLSQSSFQCVKCSLSFENRAALSRHLSFHKDEKRFVCSICKAGFTMLTFLAAHKKTHGGSKIYKCDMCQKTFGHVMNLRCHLRIHTGERPYECPHCHQTFTWKAAKRRHIRLHTGERPYACEFCSKRFIDFCGWQNHTWTHTKEKPYSCEECSFHTSTLGAMTVHKRKHSGEHPYNCRLCTKAFHSSGQLTVHMKLHHGKTKPKNIVCEVCGKRFQCPSNLKLHSRKHTGEKPYKCTTCEATFGWHAALKRHEQTHSKEKPYTCDICNRSFADRPYLNRHKLSHTGERPFKCDLCPSTFVVSYDLKQHMKIHTNEKKFICEVCGMSFVRKCYLFKHKRIHFGVKTHQCDTCGKYFFEPNRLRDHMKRHEKQKLKPPPGSKHHLCSTCGKGFAKKAYLVKHVMTHTGNKPYICDTCGAKFVDSFKLKRHKNIHSRSSRSSAHSKMNSAEMLALGQLGIKILTDAAAHVKQEQETTVVENKEEVVGELEDGTTQLIIIQQDDKAVMEGLQLQEDLQQAQEHQEGLEQSQQIIISQPQSETTDQMRTDQPYEVIILECVVR